MRPEFTVALPERREDGSWRFPCQVIVQTHGKWSGFGISHFELVGFACDPEHVTKLNRCLL